MPDSHPWLQACKGDTPGVPSSWGRPSCTGSVPATEGRIAHPHPQVCRGACGLATLSTAVDNAGEEQTSQGHPDIRAAPSGGRTCRTCCPVAVCARETAAQPFGTTRRTEDLRRGLEPRLLPDLWAGEQPSLTAFSAFVIPVLLVVWVSRLLPSPAPTLFNAGNMLITDHYTYKKYKFTI